MKILVLFVLTFGSQATNYSLKAQQQQSVAGREIS
jgi:hypothetical protein